MLYRFINMLLPFGSPPTNLKPYPKIGDIFANEILTGLIPATSATLTSDVSAGLAYIGGKRLVTPITSLTYTARNYSYIDLSSAGAFTKTEVSSESVIHSCDTAWNEYTGTGVTASVDTSDKQVGTGSAKFVITSALAANSRIATATLPNMDFSQTVAYPDGYVYFRFRIKSSITITANKLKILFDNTAACASPLESIFIDVDLTANTWTSVRLKLETSFLDSSLISIGLYQDTDIGACTIRLDDFSLLNGVITEPSYDSSANVRIARVNTDSLSITEVLPYSINTFIPNSVIATDANGKINTNSGISLIDNGGSVPVARQFLVNDPTTAYYQGMVFEQGQNIFEFGINATQLGPVDSNIPGSLFRFDMRNYFPFFQVMHTPPGGSEYFAFAIGNDDKVEIGQIGLDGNAYPDPTHACTVFADASGTDFAIWTYDGVSAYVKTVEFSGGDLKLNQVGKGIYIKEGTNACMGVATLVAGTVTVSTTKVTANSRIFLTPQTLGTILRPTGVGVTARSAGTSFTIKSMDATDTSVIAWQIIEPSA